MLSMTYGGPASTQAVLLKDSRQRVDWIRETHVRIAVSYVAGAVLPWYCSLRHC